MRDHDFYPTPPEVTMALLRAEKFQGVIWEPACGDGAISRELEKVGYTVASSDLIDRGFGKVQDFFAITEATISNVVTNPPYSLAQPFVETALKFATKKVAMLLQLSFLEGQKRNAWLQSSPLRTVHVFSNRVSLYKGGDSRNRGGKVAYAWFVWEQGYSQCPEIKWMTTKLIKVDPLRARRPPTACG